MCLWTVGLSQHQWPELQNPQSHWQYQTAPWATGLLTPLFSSTMFTWSHDSGNWGVCDDNSLCFLCWLQPCHQLQTSHQFPHPKAHDYGKVDSVKLPGLMCILQPSTRAVQTESRVGSCGLSGAHDTFQAEADHMARPSYIQESSDGPRAFPVSQILSSYGHRQWDLIQSPVVIRVRTIKCQKF